MTSPNKKAALTGLISTLPPITWALVERYMSWQATGAGVQQQIGNNQALVACFELLKTCH